MTYSSVNTTNQSKLLATFFRKPLEAIDSEIDTQVSETPKKRFKGLNRPGARPNYYIYNSETKEVIELERQCSYPIAYQAFTYVASLATSKTLTLWSVHGQLEYCQKLKSLKHDRAGDVPKITPNHPLRIALEKIGLNFDKKKPSIRSGKTVAIPKITLKILGAE